MCTFGKVWLFMGNGLRGKLYTRINLTALLLLVAVIGAVFVMEKDEGVVYAAKKRTVKVGFFPMEGYHELQEDGSYAGMDAEYLENLCDYTDWAIEFVPCDSWDEALRLLEEKEIDLVGSAQYSLERAEIFQYANLASGYTFGTIAVEADSFLAYEDFEAMQDITYGIVATYVRKQEFHEYLADHHITSPKVREYENTAALHEALAEGKIDAIVHSLTEVREGQRVIGRFAPMPFYYISYPGNDDVMRELNQGIADVKMNRPELENELMVKYYDSRLDQTVLLTSEEKQYLEEKGTLTVGYLDGYYPFSYEDENGEYRGLAVQVLEEVSVSTGVSFAYVKMADLEEAKQALLAGDIDLISYCDETPRAMKEDGVELTKSYAQVPQVLIRKRNHKAEQITTLAAAGCSTSKEGDIGFAGEYEQVLLSDSQEQCLRAVESGRADAALCDGYLAEYLMGTVFSLGKLEIYTVLNDSHIIYMAVKDDMESPLLGILNKELLAVTDKMVNDYMLRDNFYARMSVESFIRDHSIPIILLLTGCALLVILVLYHMLKNSRRIQKLMYKDSDFDIWNLNYLKYRASLKLTEDRTLKYAIVFTDICQFKSYNAIYGWRAGQRLLELSIGEISSQIDSVKELYARSNGSHFVLFVCYDTIESLKNRLLSLEDRISDRIYQETGIRMAQAMGICAVDQEDTDVQLALSNAIQAVDSLKGSHSNATKFYDDALEGQMKERHEREKLLDSVDFHKDFVAYYQAKVDIRDEQIVGAEALVRFKDPTDNGAIRAPGFFVPYYEQTGRITEIDFFVMESVCRMLRRRIDEGRRVVPVSCNFSRMHFVKEGFPEKIKAVLNKYQVPKELIEVEITETLVVEEMQQQRVKENVSILRANGVRLSIDDFGSGYSSLGVFEQIPASVIKLDRSFLLNNENRTRQVQIMRNIVNLANDLDVQVVCEGVETQNDTELMMEIGAYVAQGYRYCRPIPEQEFEGMLG